MDYIPHKDAEFDGWYENLKQYVDEKTGGNFPEWNFIPSDARNALNDAYETWHQAYLVTQGAHTKVDTEAKNDARTAATAVIRPFVSQYLNFPPVTNEDRTAMRLHNKDTKPTPVPVPETRVVITDIRALGGFQIRIWFRDEHSVTSQAVPYGFNGGLLNYEWSKERITDVTKLKETKLLTRSPETITLPPESQTNFFSCVIRWQNQKGELGPWGDVEHVVIT
jgi:hypothetical protein